MVPYENEAFVQQPRWSFRSDSYLLPGSPVVIPFRLQILMLDDAYSQLNSSCCKRIVGLLEHVA